MYGIYDTNSDNNIIKNISYDSTIDQYYNYNNNIKLKNKSQNSDNSDNSNNLDNSDNDPVRNHVKKNDHIRIKYYINKFFNK